MRRFMRFAARLITSADSPRPALGPGPLPSKELGFHKDHRERISEIVSHDAEHLVPHLASSLSCAIEPGVVDGECCPLGEFARHAQVVRPVRRERGLRTGKKSPRGVFLVRRVG